MSDQEKPKQELKAAPKPEPIQPGEIDEALKRIREEYHGDLRAFFRDVKAKVLKQRDVENVVSCRL